jgi:hypothetical protein
MRVVRAEAELTRLGVSAQDRAGRERPGGRNAHPIGSPGVWTHCGRAWQPADAFTISAHNPAWNCEHLISESCRPKGADTSPSGLRPGVLLGAARRRSKIHSLIGLDPQAWPKLGAVSRHPRVPRAPFIASCP